MVRQTEGTCYPPVSTNPDPLKQLPGTSQFHEEGALVER